MTEEDEQVFIAYLRECSDSQVSGVLEKELKAGRSDYIRLAKNELNRRGLA